MSILCAQYAVEVQFENYVDGNTINHDALEQAFRTALQDALDRLQYIEGGAPGYRMINPLIMPMTVTSVKYETDYPHPDSLPDSLVDYEARHWHQHLVRIDELRLSELTDREYVRERIVIALGAEEALELEENHLMSIVDEVVQLAKDQSVARNR